MKRRVAVSLVLVVAAVAACEKDSTPRGSGALTAAEREPFQFLPKGAQIYFGGDYSKLQDWMKGGLGNFTMMADKVMPGIAPLMTCVAQIPGMHTTAAITVSGHSMDMRMVTTGLKIADVASCSDKAGLKATVDADKRFISVEMPMPAPTTGARVTYYALANGALYAHQTTPLGGAPIPVSATRAECEADLAALSQGAAADDATFLAQAAKADRGKTIWLVGSAAGTPLADTIGDIYASIDATSGLVFDLTMQIKKPADADKLEQGVAQLRKMSDQLPANFKDVVTGLKFDRHGERVHFALALTDAQLKSVTDQLGSMIGQRLGQR
jgi:hypothetical protein